MCHCPSNHWRNRSRHNSCSSDVARAAGLEEEVISVPQPSQKSGRTSLSKSEETKGDKKKGK